MYECQVVRNKTRVTWWCINLVGLDYICLNSLSCMLLGRVGHKRYSCMSFLAGSGEESSRCFVAHTCSHLSAGSSHWCEGVIRSATALPSPRSFFSLCNSWPRCVSLLEEKPQLLHVQSTKVSDNENWHGLQFTLVVPTCTCGFRAILVLF